MNLPASGGDPQPTADYVDGDDRFDNSYDAVSGPTDSVVEERSTAS